MVSGLGATAGCSWLGIGSPSTDEVSPSNVLEVLPVALRRMPALTVTREDPLLAAGHRAQTTWTFR